MNSSVIQEIQKGSREAFKQLYDEYFEYAFRIANAVIRNETYAADAVQETFIRVYQHVHLFDISKPFKPWFYRILINECKRILIRSSKVIPIDYTWEDQKSLSKQDTYRFEQFSDLYQAIQSLKEHQRIPIILKYLHDLTDKEIAEVLDTNINTIKSRLFKARNHLKEVLEYLEKKEGSV
ncbi:RNA polymerase sigma factor [Shimazuella alba]|uniref:Sigma-70 family RNA polymerase sigma factor n=1 Tax=Shimazuella alba TaxID=2690964 RepID=A0A6I4VR44_9BACL|nr:RNA polymerase sigma factor [Shimazuella alba]MXQ53573.1 sigma-70 family RNA polymerase sigma factor [Shimazuella alba]